jgi:hypothetical protein
MTQKTEEIIALVIRRQGPAGIVFWCMYSKNIGIRWSSEYAAFADCIMPSPAILLATPQHYAWRHKGEWLQGSNILNLSTKRR